MCTIIDIKNKFSSKDCFNIYSECMYMAIFDNTPHATNKEEHKCYCIWWCNEDIGEKDYSSVEKRRELSINYIQGNNIQGYLAYCDNKVVGWCNANTKSDCYECFCWKRFMGPFIKIALI